MTVRAEWTNDGGHVRIMVKSAGGEYNTATLDIPTSSLDNLAQTLTRMADHGYMPHTHAEPGTDYGRKQPVEPKSESDSE